MENIKPLKTMQTTIDDATAAALERLELCFSGPDCDWTRFYKPKDESQAMGTRYQLIYSALGHFVELKETQAKPISFGSNLIQFIEACLMIDPGSTGMPPGKKSGLGHFRRVT